MDKTRLFPSSRLHQRISTPLSILDATVARFSDTGAIWLFEHVPEDINETEFRDRLRSSLVDALNDFPHWSGQLQWAPVRAGGSHTERFNRPIIIYGDEKDPGVEWSVVRHPSISVQALTLSASERASGKGVWIGDEFPQSLFLSDTSLPLHDLREFEGLPAMQLQLNLFNDRGYGIGVKIAHMLADAQSLMVFVHHWAAKSRKSFSSTDTSSLMDAPIFNPILLDACATGDIDGPAADPMLVSAARQLPLHRFDWWHTNDPGYSHYLIPATENSKPSPEILSQVELSPSTSGPWTSWDFSRPVRYTQLHYPGTELDRLKEQARADGRPDISRLDALLAHIWAMVSRARGHGDSTEDVFLNFTLGARVRVSPPLSESFIGSPLFITHIKASGASACTSSVGQTASQIRDTMLQFTPDAMGAMLHDAAHEVSPQRLWQA
ncbi:uncharacterized protein PFLUO_LOCUS3763 [Penicillium psychrofluorescens]|uniref:uncharacterized protein n=1 Tax=Penicillium psychrofluorescens TaxID=3158075 RepID=UPI003CCDC1B6